MTQPLTDTQKTELELMIDRAGLSGLLEAVANIAVEKARRIETNWGDFKLARSWDDAARVVQAAAHHKRIMVVS
jgi:hypothetical protein